VSEQIAPEEFLVLRDALQPYAADIAPWLEGVLEAPLSAPARRFRAACALAAFAAEAKFWEDHGPEVAALLLRQPAGDARHWIEALRPAARRLHEPLLQAADEASTLEAARVAALALYLFDKERAEALVEFLVNANDHSYRAAVELLKREPASARLPLLRRYQALAGQALPSDRERRPPQLANLILALYELGDSEPLREHAVLSADPRLRVRLIQGMNPERMDFSAIVPLLLDEEEASPVNNVAMLAAWRHRSEPLSAELRGRLVDRFAATYRKDADPEAHAIAGLLLRAWDEPRRAALEQELGGEPSSSRSWLINAAGETMVVLDPQHFRLPGYTPPAELKHRFAIAATETTLEQFRSRVPDHKQETVASAAPEETPAMGFHLVQLAAYCNMLSRQELIPESQWCYPTSAELSPTNFDPVPEFLDKLGYRLPTEAEWEFACRCGSLTSRFVGEDAGGLRFYAWDHVRAASPQPVGRLLPNPFGLFDIYGNAAELCLAGDSQAAPTSRLQYKRRGQSYLAALEAMTSVEAVDYIPGVKSSFVGFRVARTLPDAQP
jgi:hypothetical protein